MAVAQASCLWNGISQLGMLCHEALSHRRSSHCKLNIGGNQAACLGAQLSIPQTETSPSFLLRLFISLWHSHPACEIEILR
jgi:hypothetical protein